jgi:Domain of unknown function (DUF5050)
VEDGQIYYTAANQSNLYRCNLDGTTQTPVITGGIDFALSLDVNATDSSVYFTNNRFGEYLLKSKLFINNSTKAIRHKNVYLPGPLAHDGNSERLAWINNNSYIQGDTSGRIMMQLTATTPPFEMFKRSAGAKYLGMSVDWVNDRVYYAEDSPVSIRRVKTNGTGDSQIPTAATLGAPICLRFNKQNGRLYWADRVSNKIMSILPNGADERTVATTLPLLQAFDFDTSQQMIYFAQSMGKIGRVKYDGTQLNTDLISGVNTPVAVAVNQQLNQIYYCTNGGTIYQAAKDGTQVTTLVTGSGATNLSDLIFVANPGSATHELPNLGAQSYYAQGQVHVQLDEPQSVHLSIWNMAGLPVAMKHLGHTDAHVHDATALASGVYQLLLQNEAGQMHLMKFVVAR